VVTRVATRRFNDTIEPMTLGNMRELGVRSLDRVVLALPPPDRDERRSLARSRRSANLRAADGLH
jgi:hypothetical protein